MERRADYQSPGIMRGDYIRVSEVTHVVSDVHHLWILIRLESEGITV